MTKKKKYLNEKKGVTTSRGQSDRKASQLTDFIKYIHAYIRILQTCKLVFHKSFYFIVFVYSIEKTEKTLKNK